MRTILAAIYLVNDIAERICEKREPRPFNTLVDRGILVPAFIVMPSRLNATLRVPSLIIRFPIVAKFIQVMW